MTDPDKPDDPQDSQHDGTPSPPVGSGARDNAASQATDVDAAMRDIAAQPMIDAFGGIRPMASKLGVPVSTVQGWKQRDTIPAARAGDVMAAARAQGLVLPARAAPTQQPHIPPHRPAGPRPAMRFTPPEATSEAMPEAAATVEPTPPPPVEQGAPPPAQAAPAGRAGRRALWLAAIALIVAVIWPIAFSEWRGADAQDGGDAVLAGRVDALETAAQSADPAAVQQALDQLRDDVDALGAAAPAGDPATPQVVTDALDALRQAVTGLGQVVDGLDAKIVAIDGRIGQLEARPDGVPVEPLRESVAALQATLGQIQADLQAVTATAQAASGVAVAQATALIDQRVAALNDRIAALAGTDDVAAEHQAFLIALGQLSARLRTAEPFADELAALRLVTTDATSLSAALAGAVRDGFAALDDAAARGVPTLAGLRASFDATRRAVLTAADAPPEDTLDEILGELSAMVTVSRVDGAGAGTVDGVLAAAERHLAAGDLAGAVTALGDLQSLGAGYAEAAAPWLADAGARLAADRAIEAVYQSALASFRPEPGPAAPDGAEPTD